MQYFIATSSTTGILRRLAYLSFSVIIAAASLGGCTTTPSAAGAEEGEAAVRELPQLTAVQELRNAMARTESAITERTGQLAYLATECDDCQETLIASASSSEARLSSLGGLWFPWGEFEVREDADEFVELPPQVSDAPYTVAPLSAFMAVTARQELELAARITDVEPEERQALASLLFGRLTSAWSLASWYGVDLPAAIENLPPEATSSAVPSGPAAGTKPSQSGGLETPAAKVRADALVGYDCARTALLNQTNDGLTQAQSLKIASDLGDRMKRILENDVIDGRALVCTVSDRALTSALHTLVLADLNLITSPELPDRELAAKYLVEDAQLWAQVSPISVPLVSMLSLEKENDEPQSE
ncbi:hypothetical protein [Actinomyces minihominis]|uniref:hypothetical protein n=1 Tax=Actinomyces minihominis TaxID=2002838 RepID=UPI00101AD065|nr:hypothetical protein [Actinomyces minihominis]